MILYINEIKELVKNVDDFIEKNHLTEDDFNKIYSDYIEDCQYYDDYTFDVLDDYGALMYDYKIVDVSGLCDEDYDELIEEYEDDCHFHTKISDERIYFNLKQVVLFMNGVKQEIKEFINSLPLRFREEAYDVFECWEDLSMKDVNKIECYYLEDIMEEFTFYEKVQWGFI